MPIKQNIFPINNKLIKMEGEKNKIYIFIKRPLALIKAQEKFRKKNKIENNIWNLKLKINFIL